MGSLAGGFDILCVRLGKMKREERREVYRWISISQCDAELIFCLRRCRGLCRAQHSSVCLFFIYLSLLCLSFSMCVFIYRLPDLLYLNKLII